MADLSIEGFGKVREIVGTTVAVVLALLCLAVLAWWRWDALAKKPGIAGLLRRLRQLGIVPALSDPEFIMIELFSGNEQQGSKSWTKVGERKFQRDFEFAADPVFNVMVRGKSSVILYRVGIRILQRTPGTGGMFGESQPIKVQSEFSVDCPQGWKSGLIDDSIYWTEFADPREIKKE